MAMRLIEKVVQSRTILFYQELLKSLCNYKQI